MKTYKHLLLSIGFLLFTSVCFAQVLTKQQLLEDLYYYRDTLAVKHKNLFAKITKEAFTDQVAQIAAKADTLNTDQFLYELFKLNFSIGDEHTFIEPKYLTRLPILFESYTDGIFVTNITALHADFFASKLIAINDIPINEIHIRFQKLIKHVNPSYFKVYELNFLKNPSFLKGMGITTSSDEVAYTLQNSGNEIERIKLKVIPVGGFSNGMEKTGFLHKLEHNENFTPNYWYHYNPSFSTLYFNFVYCRNDEKHPFADFNRELFAKINEVHPKKIIVDLRYNDGGNSSVIYPFLDSLNKSYLNKKGHLFVLIGKQTFSSAVMNAVYFKRNTKAILVGEMTSGNINHYGEVRGFALPNSKVVIGYSTRYWENWKGKKGGLNPDKKIKYYSANFHTWTDPALEYVYRY